HGESKSYTSLYGVLFGLVSEEIAGYKGLGTALRPLRQKLTCNLPPGWAGRGRAGPQAAATLVAGATNVTPSQPLEDPLALLGIVTSGFCRRFSFEAICGMVSPSDPCCRRRGATMAISFKEAHFPQDIILMGVRWYVAYPLSTRHVEELMLERGVHADHSTINRCSPRHDFLYIYAE